MKIRNVLTDDLIKTVCGQCDNIPEFSREVPIDEIINNDCLLVPSRYICFEEQEAKHRPYADIMADINRISRERAIIKLSVNETLAKSLGLAEFAELENGKSDDDIGKIFKLLGGKYESKRIITLTKNKNEFKIENQDKEKLSSLINFFLPMWKQHMFYLNLEENRLFAELRDAMLPELMSGKLVV